MHQRRPQQYWHLVQPGGAPRGMQFDQPTPQDMHTDAAMSILSILYRNLVYIADRVFAAVPIGKQSDKYYLYPKGAWFRDEAGIRAPGTRARRGGYVLSPDNYYCNEWAFAKEIPDEDRDNADAALTPDVTATEFATDKILLRKERLIAGLCMTPTNWTSSDDVAGDWAPGTGNTFIVDMDAAIETIRGRTGFRPNVLLMDSKTLTKIKEEATVLDRIKYTERGIVTAELVASMFGLEEVLIGDAIYSSALEKADGTDFTGVDIWETNATKGAAFLFYRQPRPALRMPSAGYTFTWHPRSVRRWREDPEKQDVVEASEHFDAKVTGADLGHLFYDTILT